MTTVDLTQDQVKIGRLQRKLLRTQKQRDHYKERLSYYEKVISMQPYIERRYTNYLEMKKETDRIKNLEVRVKEQAKLIQLLEKGEK